MTGSSMRETLVIPKRCCLVGISRARDCKLTFLIISKMIASSLLLLFSLINAAAVNSVASDVPATFLQPADCFKFDIPSCGDLDTGNCTRLREMFESIGTKIGSDLKLSVPINVEIELFNELLYITVLEPETTYIGNFDA